MPRAASPRVRLRLLALAAALVLTAPGARGDEPRVIGELSIGGAPFDRAVQDGKYDVTAGVSVRVRAGPLELGPVALVSQGRGGDVVSDSIRLGGAAGYAVPSGPWRLALLVEGGVHWIDHVHETSYESSGLSLGGWSIAQRARVTLPYAGVRAGVGWRRVYDRSWDGLWSRATWVGVSLFARRDLATRTAVVDYAQVDWFRAPSVRTVAYRVGGWSVGVVVDVALGW